jgi:hypothetical protein
VEKDKKELLDNFLRLDYENQANVLARIRNAYTAQENSGRTMTEPEVRQYGLTPGNDSALTAGLTGL